MAKRQISSTDPVLLVVRAEGGYRYEIRRYRFALPLEAGQVVLTEQEARQAGALAFALLKGDPARTITRTR